MNKIVTKILAGTMATFLIGGNALAADLGSYKIETKENVFKVSVDYKLNTLSAVDFKNSASPSTTIFGLPQNMGPWDRSLRGVIAAGLIGAGTYGLMTNNIGKEWSIAMLGVSAIPIATGATGYCPLYQLFGVDYSF